MSEAASAHDEHDELPAPVVFQRDPVRTRRRRRIGLTVAAVVWAAFCVLGFATPPGRLVFAIFLAPPAIILAVLAKAWWNTDPVKVVIDRAGITKRAQHVPWCDVERVELSIEALREGGWVAVFMVRRTQSRRALWFMAHDVGAYVPQLVDAFERFAPAEVLDASLQAYRNGPGADQR